MSIEFNFKKTVWQSELMNQLLRCMSEITKGNETGKNTYRMTLEIETQRIKMYVHSSFPLFLQISNKYWNQKI